MNLLKIFIIVTLWTCLSGKTFAEINKTIVPDNPEKIIEVILETTLGNIELILYQKKAPVTVINFLRYIDAGHYNAGQFTRTVRLDNDNGSPKIVVIQGTARPDAKLFPPIKLETTKETGILHSDGVISMARAEPHTAQDQFFITIGEQPSLDFEGKRNSDGQGFAAFGKVVSGMEVVKKINAIREAKETDNAYTKGQYLANPVIIKSAYRK